MSTPCCPICGTPVPGDRVLVTLESNTVTYKGKSIKISSKPAELMTILAARMPKVVTYASLIAGVYGTIDEPEYAHKCVQVWVCHLRRDLKSIGLTIETVHGRGYKLVSSEDASTRLGGGKLTSDDVRGIRAYPGSCADIAVIFRISRQNVHQILTRKTWRHVT